MSPIRTGRRQHHCPPRRARKDQPEWLTEWAGEAQSGSAEAGIDRTLQDQLGQVPIRPTHAGCSQTGAINGVGPMGRTARTGPTALTTRKPAPAWAAIDRSGKTARNQG